MYINVSSKMMDTISRARESVMSAATTLLDTPLPSLVPRSVGAGLVTTTVADGLMTGISVISRHEEGLQVKENTRYYSCLAHVVDVSLKWKKQYSTTS